MDGGHFSGLKANTISPIQNAGSLRFRDTRQKVVPMKTVFSESAYIQKKISGNGDKSV
jgi:hypothetical protein